VSTTRVRILTLALSSLFAAGMVGAALYWLRRRPVDSVRLEHVDADKLFANRAAAPTAAGAPTRGEPALGAKSPLFPASTLKRRTLTNEELTLLYPNREQRNDLDPQTHYRYQGGLKMHMTFPEYPGGGFDMRTNSLGLRENREVLPQQPDLRVLVTGDSHSDGVCDADQTYTHVLERLVAAARPGKSIEALNASVGGYTFYNYLGALERYLPLAPDVFIVGVYGGNDFEEMLTLYHYFEGTKRPPGAADYNPQIQAAVAVCRPALSQAFLSLKYFQHNPGEIEVALQGARDISTEMVVTCLRNGIHPIFVYIPPMHSVEFEQHRKIFEDLAHALELEPDDLRITDRMADSYLAYLRSIRVDVLDMRDEFAASKEELYWQADHHINLKGHEQIARSLLPLLEAVYPPDATRVRGVGTHTEAAPIDTTRSPPTSAPGPANSAPAPHTALPAPAAVKVSGDPLKGFTLAPEEVEQLFQLRADQEYDTKSLFRYASKLSRSIGRASFATNSLGLLGAEEPSSAQPNVLLLGDEVVYAPGDDGPTCGVLIERAHGQVKCLDACTAGYGLFNYLGTLDRLSDLKPAEVVLVVDATSDLSSVVPAFRATQLERDSKRPPREQRNPRDKPLDDGQPKPGEQRLIQAGRVFQERPGTMLVATRYAAEVVLEIDRRCKARGMSLSVVVVPPASDPRVQGAAGTVAKARAALEGAEDALLPLAQLHAAFIATLKEHGVSVLDFGDTISAAPEPLVDANTLRLNGSGRVALAKLIAAGLKTQR
jgi:hypothetical protein